MLRKHCKVRISMPGYQFTIDSVRLGISDCLISRNCEELIRNEKLTLLSRKFDKLGVYTESRGFCELVFRFLSNKIYVFAYIPTPRIILEIYAEVHIDRILC